jgi:beta-galactosidase
MRTAGLRPLTVGVLHDGNFVIDGLVFPDRTPLPGLLEYKKVSEPVRITVDPPARTIGVRNLHHTRDTYLRWGGC